MPDTQNTETIIHSGQQRPTVPPLRPGTPPAGGQAPQPAQSPSAPQQAASASAAGRPVPGSGRPIAFPKPSGSSSGSTGGNASPTSFSSKLEPQKSKLGTYIMIGAIVILVLLLLYQVISKGGLRGQVRNLEQQVKTLTEQNSSLTAEVSRLQSAAAAVAQQPVVAPGQLPASQTDTVQTPTARSSGYLFYPLMYRDNQYQKAAQTIRLTSAAEIDGFYLRGESGKGSSGQVSIYENHDFGRLNEQDPIAKRSFEPSKMPTGSPFSVKFDKSIALKANTPYLLVIETTKKDTEARMAYTASRPEAPGNMWVYSRKVAPSGEVLDSQFSWQELPGFDLAFELRADL